MNELNFYAIASLAIRILGIAVIMAYIIPKQIMEVTRPRDWLTKLRIHILLLFVFSILSAVPSITYQVMRSQGYESDMLRNIATVSGSLSQLVTILLLVLIYNYRAKQ